MYQSVVKAMTSRMTMKSTFKSVSVLTALVCLFAASPAQAQALNIDDIINSTNQAAAKERRANTARENGFKAERSKQQGRLNAMTNERVRQERISDELDRQFKVNEAQIETLQDELAKELGDLKQLFGVIQLSASEAQESYRSSIISAQFPDRAENLRQMVAKMASLTELVLHR